MQTANSVTAGLAATALLVLGAVPAAAEDETAGIEPAYPVVELAEVLNAVARRSGKTFIVDADVHGQIQIGRLNPRDLDLAVLHSVLFGNRLAAVDTGGARKIVPVHRIRQQALPLVGDGGAEEFAEDEWVMRLLPLDNMEAAALVPMVRPLLPQEAYMVADRQSNTLLIADRYAKIGRLTAMIERLDARALQTTAGE